MEETPQNSSQSVAEHGRAVWEKTKKLISGQFQDFRLPEWFVENHRYLVNNLHSPKRLKEYTLLHDCGKPFCLEIDEDGKRHFPDHANISKQTYLNIGLDPVVADLIGLDMALHPWTADQIAKSGWDKKTAFTLLLVAFAEIHANAEAFGGMDSHFFKSKWKKLKRRGKQILCQFPEGDEHPYSYVIVRSDKPDAQKMVQGTHASIEQFKGLDVNYHPSIIYVKVKSERKLQMVAERLLEDGIDFSIFREPDAPYNNSITAICTEPLPKGHSDYLSRFQLV